MVYDIIRFKNKVSKKDKNGCMKWLGWKNDDGYGKFSVGKVYKFAHRVSYEINVGPISDGKCVLHKCDVRSCVNPDHLYVGTQKENNRDAHERKRRSSVGSNNGNSILKEKDVIIIKNAIKRGITCASLSRKYKVSESCINDIKHGRSWKYLK